MSIGIVAPASPVTYDDIKGGIHWLQKNGFTVKTGKNIYKADRFMAGSDQERADDINEMFADDDIDIIIAARGGYGSGRILPYVDYENVKKHKKTFIGLSDITALQLAILKKADLPSYTGMVIKTDFTPDPEPLLSDSIFAVVSGKKQHYNRLTRINGGKVTARIIGGNLTMIASLAGTEFFPDFTDSILFIEEIGEQPFRVDRMLNTLDLCGVFKKIKGIVIGDFSVKESNDPADGSLDEVFRERFTRLPVPVVKDFMNGHIKNKYLLKIGATVTLDADKGEIHEI